MTSAFGWLDNDDEQRRRMLEVVDLFREQGTIDELGIGSIRDTLSNALFPGTSTLHTRLRYVLFLPWLMQQAQQKESTQAMVAGFRVLEYELIESLLASGKTEGVMGNVARARLKRLPSVAYWSALRVWGLVDAASTEAYFHRYQDFQRLSQRTAHADDAEARDLLPTSGIDAQLPPAPDGLMSMVDFTLTPREESYLSDRIATSTKGSLLAWLVSHQPANVSRDAGPGLASFPWEIENLHELDTELADLVEHGRRFSLIVHGAALVYNVALARKGNRDDVLETHEKALAEWQASEDPEQVARNWNRETWWKAIADHGTQVRPGTRIFIESWLDIVSSGARLVASEDAVRLVANRERQIKGSRARFVNQSALDGWPGSSGLGRLDFRWGISRSHLLDLYAARALA